MSAASDGGRYAAELLQAFDEHVRNHGYGVREGEGLLAVLESAARQLGIPHMTDAERPEVDPVDPPPPPNQVQRPGTGPAARGEPDCD